MNFNKKSVIKTSIFCIIVMFAVGFTSFTTADTKDYTNKLCQTKDCEKEKSLLSQKDYNALSDSDKSIVFPHVEKEKEEIKPGDYIELFGGVIIPIVVFFWWLINTQQEKKTLEHAAKIEADFDERIAKIKSNQDLNLDKFWLEFEKLDKKLDKVNEQIVETQMRYLKKMYEQNEKINILLRFMIDMKEFKSRTQDIENFLRTNHNYVIREK